MYDVAGYGERRAARVETIRQHVRVYLKYTIIFCINELFS